MDCPHLFRFSDEVREALASNGPIVALESTIISHGLPYPENEKLALELESIVRSKGAVPATIALIGGKVLVGLTEADLHLLADPSNNVQKVSRRDIAFVLSQRLIGATTVASTSLLAAKAGIRVFATGGIGGVHREGHKTMDISADLTELGRTEIAVVSAGVKSILDIGRTLEYLETQGVTVVGYGTDEFPAFFTARSGFTAPCRLDTAEQCANLIHHNLLLNLSSGIIIANPIPSHLAADGEQVEKAISVALTEVEEKKILGRDVRSKRVKSMFNTSYSILFGVILGEWAPGPRRL
eukprot:TRINITY_DN9335_c0_g1_i10.p1 TRINITY_DN9335_c0_g1~~TRINITY_DN9335_c0_g1_i10.p1  ORF type:complete len:297 (-),score=65.06 TRINITY_DN9335_c0_g1_i10:42-932(-)